MELGYAVLTKTSDVAAPASGATAVLYNSTLNVGAVGRGARIKTLIINVESSHDSAADGLKIYESDDDGTTWKTVYTRTYTQAVDGRLKVMISELGAPETKVEYVNSANTLTTWRFSLLADFYERSL